MDRFGIVLDERQWQALQREAMHPDTDAIRLRDEFVRRTRGNCWKQDGDTAVLEIPDEQVYEKNRVTIEPFSYKCFYSEGLFAYETQSSTSLSGYFSQQFCNVKKRANKHISFKLTQRDDLRVNITYNQAASESFDDFNKDEYMCA